MKQDNKIKLQLFESIHIRSIWDEAEEKRWLSALDVVAALTDQADYAKSRNYWKWLKNKLKLEGSEVVSVTHQLKMQAPDGKQRLTDVLDVQQVLRIIQSIPSKKAEPFKLWLADVANQRLDQLQDPELSIEQAMLNYKRLGYSDNWINQRLKSIEIRKRETLLGEYVGTNCPQIAMQSASSKLRKALAATTHFFTNHKHKLFAFEF